MSLVSNPAGAAHYFWWKVCALVFKLVLFRSDEMSLVSGRFTLVVVEAD